MTDEPRKPRILLGLNNRLSLKEPDIAREHEIIKQFVVRLAHNRSMYAENPKERAIDDNNVMKFLRINLPNGWSAQECYIRLYCFLAGIRDSLLPRNYELN